MTNRDIEVERQLPLSPAFFHILIALGEGDRHGYAIMQEVSERAGGAGDALVRAPGEHMRMILHDLRYAARALRGSPMFTLVAIATLALGIGANTAIFSVVHAVALQALPNQDSDRLVRLWEKNDKLRIPQFSASVPNYYSWRERVHSFDELAAWRSNTATLTTGGDPQRLSKLEA